MFKALQQTSDSYSKINKSDTIQPIDASISFENKIFVLTENFLDHLLDSTCLSIPTGKMQMKSFYEFGDPLNRFPVVTPIYSPTSNEWSSGGTTIWEANFRPTTLLDTLAQTNCFRWSLIAHAVLYSATADDKTRAMVVLFPPIETMLREEN